MQLFAAIHLHDIFLTLYAAYRPRSPKPMGKPRRAPVDTALALDEITQRLIQVLVFCSVPQHSRPPTLRFVTLQSKS